MAGELTRFGSRISLVSGVDKEDVDVTFLNTHTLHHVSDVRYMCAELVRVELMIVHKQPSPHRLFSSDVAPCTVLVPCAYHNL